MNAIKIRFAAGIVALLGFVGICSGSTSIELQSSYLGDGWFRYRMKTFPEPFLRHLDIQQVYLNSLSTNWLGYEYGNPPLDWQSGPINQAPAWSYQLPYPSQQRPYEREFMIRSPERTFRYVTNAVTLLMGLDIWSGGYGNVYSLSIVGYANFSCLVPCRPEQADGSLSNQTAVLRMVDTDMSIDSLVVTNGMVTGVTFLAPFKSTLLLEATTDYSQWTNIAYIWADLGTNTWTTNTPLNDYGQFFRIEIVAYNEHVNVTNLPPLSAKSAPVAKVSGRPATPAGPALTCHPQGDDVAIQFQSETGQDYEVQAIDGKGKAVVTQTVPGTGERIEIRFQTANLPNPVFFSAKRR